LPEVKEFILGKGNADSYVALKLNFIPHHSPELVIYDEDGGDGEVIDMSVYGFKGLKELMEKKGFTKKELI